MRLFVCFEVILFNVRVGFRTKEGGGEGGEKKEEEEGEGKGEKKERQEKERKNRYLLSIFLINLIASS